MVFLQSDRFSNKNRRLISHCAFLVFVCSEDVRSANIVAEENDVACLVIDREWVYWVGKAGCCHLWRRGLLLLQGPICLLIHHHLEVLANLQLQGLSVKIHGKERAFWSESVCGGGRCWQTKYFVCKVCT